MPRIESPNWDENSDVCEIHGIMGLPCTLCLAERQEDIGVRLTAEDLEALDSVGVPDLFRDDMDWLIERIIA
jgi:hypothetical protein